MPTQPCVKVDCAARHLSQPLEPRTVVVQEPTRVENVFIEIPRMSVVPCMPPLLVVSQDQQTAKPESADKEQQTEKQQTEKPESADQAQQAKPESADQGHQAKPESADKDQQTEKQQTEKPEKPETADKEQQTEKPESADQGQQAKPESANQGQQAKPESADQGHQAKPESADQGQQTEKKPESADQGTQTENTKLKVDKPAEDTSLSPSHRSGYLTSTLQGPWWRKGPQAPAVEMSDRPQDHYAFFWREWQDQLDSGKDGKGKWGGAGPCEDSDASPVSKKGSRSPTPGPGHYNPEHPAVHGRIPGRVPGHPKLRRNPDIRL